MWAFQLGPSNNNNNDDDESKKKKKIKGSSRSQLAKIPKLTI